MSNFQISDKVVCVDAVPGMATINGEYQFPNGYIRHGEVYTVCGISEEQFREGFRWRLFLTGKPAVGRKTNRDRRWRLSRFRKLEDIREERRIAARAEHDGQKVKEEAR